MEKKMKRSMRSSKGRTCLKLFLMIVLTLTVLQAPSVSAVAQNRYVSTTGFDTANTCLNIANPCATISYAITQANAGDSIHIFAGTYNPVHLDITKTLYFYGAGEENTFLDGGYSDRVVSIGSGLTVNFIDLTIRNGMTDVGGQGGGIYQPNSTTTLTLLRVNVTGNIAEYGAGITSSGTLNIIDSEISNNSASLSSGSLGGAMFLTGTGVSTTLEDVTIRGNTANSDSGGIHYQIDNSSGGLMMLTNVTISDNTAKTSTAGVITNSGKVTFINSTIAGNHITGGAGSNTGGITNFATVKIANSIFAYNDDRNCNVGGSSWTTYGNNIDSGSTCGFGNPAYHDTQNTDPRLGPLAENGGYVQTMALLRGSPAIDGVIYLAPNAAPVRDARLVPRPFGPRYDIGAYECDTAWIYLPLIRK
jgi:hypothetical protein